MDCESLEYEAEAAELPAAFAALVAEADRQWVAFREAGRGIRHPRYVASEPAQVYAALRHLRASGLAPGDHFVEWGSGFGVATDMAALLGFRATGIEIEIELVEQARTLAARCGIDASFLCGDYVPAGFVSYRTIGGADIRRDDSFGHAPEQAPHYPDMDISLEEVDVFFVYPWPGEQAMALKLFDAVAGPDAILAAYFGDREIRLYRKTV